MGWTGIRCGSSRGCRWWRKSRERRTGWHPSPRRVTLVPSPPVVHETLPLLARRTCLGLDRRGRLHTPVSAPGGRNDLKYKRLTTSTVSTQKASGTEVSSGCYYSVMVRGPGHGTLPLDWGFCSSSGYLHQLSYSHLT